MTVSRDLCGQALFRRVYDPSNLFLAFSRARRGLAIKTEANIFEEKLEYNIMAISQQLRDHEYAFGPYQAMTVRDPKQRLIHIAPFPDRVVHHSINAVIEPILDSGFIEDSYACRKDKGNLRAIKRLQSWLDGDPTIYVLKMDVTKYFASIDRGILLKQLQTKIRDADLLRTLERLVLTAPYPIRRGCGLPIGNLTSQSLANAYLNSLDHYAKDFLGERRYLRYVDDFVCVGSKERLHELRGKFEDFLKTSLHLAVAEKKSKVLAAKNGIPFLGFVLAPNRRPRLRKEALKRFFWKIRRARRMRLSEPEIAQKIVSWYGYSRLADVRFLLKVANAEKYLDGMRVPNC